MTHNKRHSQGSCCGGPVRLDGEKVIRRCVDCSQNKTCEVCKEWKWFHGPLPYDCPLPKAPEDAEEEKN